MAKSSVNPRNNIFIDIYSLVSLCLLSNSKKEYVYVKDRRKSKFIINILFWARQLMCKSHERKFCI